MRRITIANSMMRNNNKLRNSGTGANTDATPTSGTNEHMSSWNAHASAQKQHRRRCYVSLACSIGSISLACGSLLQIPNSTDRITLQRGLFLTSLGFIYFVSLTDFCNKYLLETPRGVEFRKKYRLMISDVMEITNKIVSAIQATFSFLVGFIVCKSTCSKSFIYASHFLMEAYGWFGTAYFMYDIWSMYKVHTQKISDKLNLMCLAPPSSSLAMATDATTSAIPGGQTAAGGGRIATGRLTTKTNGHATTNGICLLYDKAAGDMSDNNKVHSPICCTGKDDHVDNYASTKTTTTTTNTTTTTDLNYYDYDDDDDASTPTQSPTVGHWDFFKYVIAHPVMMIHHVFIGTFGLLVVTYIRGGGHCIYSYMFMMEFSTPFVSLRSILSTMGLKNSRVYIVNGLTMLGSFFICRVLMWPYVMWRYSIAIDATFWQALSGLPYSCIVSVLILFLPQIYWFFLMVKGALKVFSSGKPKQKQQHDRNGVDVNKYVGVGGEQHMRCVKGEETKISNNANNGISTDFNGQTTKALCQAMLEPNSAN